MAAVDGLERQREPALPSARELIADGVHVEHVGCAAPSPSIDRASSERDRTRWWIDHADAAVGGDTLERQAAR